MLIPEAARTCGWSFSEPTASATSSALQPRTKTSLNSVTADTKKDRGQILLKSAMDAYAKVSVEPFAHLHHGRLCKVPLQTELELREEAQEGERGVEVDVIRIPHDVLNALQVQKLANAIVGVDKGLRLWYGQNRLNT